MEQLVEYLSRSGIKLTDKSVAYDLELSNPKGEKYKGILMSYEEFHSMKSDLEKMYFREFPDNEELNIYEYGLIEYKYFNRSVGSTSPEDSVIFIMNLTKGRLSISWYSSVDSYFEVFYSGCKVLRRFSNININVFKKILEI